MLNTRIKHCEQHYKTFTNHMLNAQNQHYKKLKNIFWNHM
jgi:hypothetical protein